MVAVAVVIVLVLVALAGAALSVRILKQYERGVLFRLGKRQGRRARAGAGPHHPAGRSPPPRLAADRHDADPVAGDHHARQRQRRRLSRRLLPHQRCRSARWSPSRTSLPRSTRSRRRRCAPSSAVTRWTRRCPRPSAINRNIREILDVQTEEWGVQVTVVELKDIQLPGSMKRAMARQAEAEREKRAKIIAAEGEALAAGELAHASDVMMAHPLALQLRNLQTLVEISVDKNSTVVFPAPLMSTIQELGAFLERETRAVGAVPRHPGRAERRQPRVRYLNASAPGRRGLLRPAYELSSLSDQGQTTTPTAAGESFVRSSSGSVRNPLMDAVPTEQLPRGRWRHGGRAVDRPGALRVGLRGRPAPCDLSSAGLLAVRQDPRRG